MECPSREISQCHINIYALFSLRRYTNLSKLKTALARKVFDAMISPILTCTCNSEIWGVYAEPDLSPGTAHKLERHTFNFANVTKK